MEDFYFSQKGAAEVKKKTRRSTASQLIPLRQTAERLITTGIGKIYPDIWKLVHEHFEVEHIHQLEPTQITEAVEFLNALEGEFLGKEELPALEIKQQISDDDLQTLCWLWQHSINMARYMIDIEPLLKVAEHKLAATYYGYPRNSIRCANNARRILEKATEHIQIKQIQLDNWRVLHSLRIPNSPF
ncbi:P22AR C-terminal domain-containing protein [Photorhabdus namnaonensis]|uniref:P22AR C-terminal domain-containing protein n=1 Tax=Photorhabdus namnaonensis TaxID=1851568 RepID=UPI00308415EE